MRDLNSSKSAETASEKVPIEIVEESAKFDALRLSAIEPNKAATARILALILTLTFSGLLMCSLIVGFYVLKRSSQIDDKTLAASTEFLKAVSSVFSPLLAFVLGYYFSKREE